jgi:predicted transcriptional regulator
LQAILHKRAGINQIIVGFGVESIILSNHSAHREKIYVIKDLILKLFEKGELDQTSLIGFCGLNLARYKLLLNHMESNNLINSTRVTSGKKISTIYKPTQKGVRFCTEILGPFEEMFPRKSSSTMA